MDNNYTKKYKIPTIFEESIQPGRTDRQLIALDAGYSSIKVFAKNGYFAFPSFAKPVQGELLQIAIPRDTDILFREKGETWYVGDIAQRSVDVGDVNEKESSLFARNRYFSPMYRILCLTGIAMGITNKLPVFVQTGLPPEYLDDDAEYVKDTIAGVHSFELKIGRGDWKKYDFVIIKEHIRLISQPLGSLMSVIFDKVGKPAYQREFMQKNLCVLDPGFGTLDTFSFQNLAAQKSQTYSNFGMKAVLKKTIELLHKNVSLTEFQSCLETGEIEILDMRKMQTNSIPIENALRTASRTILRSALEEVKASYNFFQGYDCIIVTGGTGAAWFRGIKDHFSGMKSLKVIPVNHNDPEIPFIFGNVRGYYFFALGLCDQWE